MTLMRAANFNAKHLGQMVLTPQIGQQCSIKIFIFVAEVLYILPLNIFDHIKKEPRPDSIPFYLRSLILQVQRSDYVE